MKLRDTTAVSLLEELNSKRKRFPLWYLSAALTAGALIAVLRADAPQWTVFVVLLVGAALAVPLYMRDQLMRTTVLFYDLEQDAERSYREFLEIFEEMADCAGAWHIGAEGKVIDRKRESGATNLVDRRRIKLSEASPPLVSTNIPVPTIPVGAQVLYFFPDRLLVFTKEGVGAVNYKDLAVTVSPTRFIEAEGVPKDAEVVGHTWRYVNKDGGPDRRFKDNRQIPIALYEQVDFASPSGLQERIELSKAGVASKVPAAIETLAGLGRQVS